jgi:ribosome-associated protein
LIEKEREVEAKVLLCINTMLEKKAKDIIVINIKALSSFTDYFVISSGTSDRQVKALASVIQESLKRSGILPLGVEGEMYGKWVLIDYDDVVVHIFQEPVRAFYDLERLWPEAPRMEISDDTTEVTSLD